MYWVLPNYLDHKEEIILFLSVAAFQVLEDF